MALSTRAASPPGTTHLPNDLRIRVKAMDLAEARWVVGNLGVRAETAVREAFADYDRRGQFRAARNGASL